MDGKDGQIAEAIVSLKSEISTLEACLAGTVQSSSPATIAKGIILAATVVDELVSSPGTWAAKLAEVAKTSGATKIGSA